MKVKVKKLHSDAIIPKYSKPGDAGLDLTATRCFTDDDGNMVYGTDLAIEIPEGHVALLFPRSSNSKKNLLLSNSVGVVDSGYRGEIMFKFKKDPVPNRFQEFAKFYEPGERVGQMIIIPYPQIELEEVQELSSTDRGAGGFGSTGK